MLPLYIFALIVGGSFVLASVVAGMEHGSDLSGAAFHALEGAGVHTDGLTDLSSALQIDVSTDMAGLPSVEHAAEHLADLVPSSGNAHAVEDVGSAFLPWKSMRFYTFGSCFFGLTGVLLSFFTGTPAPVTFLTSIAMGSMAGTVVTCIIQKLSTQNVSSAVTERDYPGTLGRILVAIAPGGTGKIRCHLRGQTIDLLAESDESVPLEPGQQVLIVSYEDAIAHVVHSGRLNAFLESLDLKDGPS